jgi:hypothetical protein
MPLASKHTYLLDGGATSGVASWDAGLLQINSYPDLEGDMETGEITTLGDDDRLSMPTIRSESSWTIEANYLAANLAALKALEGTEHYYGIYHGGTLAVPTGANGKTRAKGYMTAREKGAGVGDIVKMEIKIALSEEPVVGESVLIGVLLSGTPQDGVETDPLVLTYNMSLDDATLDYQWKRCATIDGTYTNISGAESATYTPVTGDVGYYLKCQVTASGTASGTVLSNALIVIAA